MIEIPTRGSILGSLDQSVTLLERASHSLNVNLENGEVRFKSKDVDRMKQYVKKIRLELRKIEPVVKEFSLIAR